MSDQAAPPQTPPDSQPAQQAAPPAAAQQLHQAHGPDAAKLHDLALGAEKNLEALATGLAQAHADPQAVKACGQMAEVMRKMVSMMAKQAQHAPPPAQRPTIASATNDMVAQRHQAPAQPPQ